MLLLLLLVLFIFCVKVKDIYIYMYSFCVFLLFPTVVEKTPIDCSYKNINFLSKSRKDNLVVVLVEG